jgi:hypothetical protein
MMYVAARLAVLFPAFLSVAGSTVRLESDTAAIHFGNNKECSISLVDGDLITSCPLIQPPDAGTSCKELKDNGATESGVYNLIDGDGNTYENYCDMVTAGGGWTLAMKIKEKSHVFHGSKKSAWIEEFETGDMSTVADEDAVGKSYKTVPFTDIMLNTIKDGAQQSGLVAWHHPAGPYDSLKSTVVACNKIEDGQHLEGSFTDVACNSQNSVNTIPSNCDELMNMCSNTKYGFNIPDSGLSGTKACDKSPDYSTAIIGGGTGGQTSCVTTWGVGSGYASVEPTDDAQDENWGINYHWWGAGNYRLGTNIPIASVGVFIR